MPSLYHSARYHASPCLCCSRRIVTTPLHNVTQLFYAYTLHSTTKLFRHITGLNLTITVLDESIPCLNPTLQNIQNVTTPLRYTSYRHYAFTLLDHASLRLSLTNQVYTSLCHCRTLPFLTIQCLYMTRPHLSQRCQYYTQRYPTLEYSTLTAYYGNLLHIASP